MSAEHAGMAAEDLGHYGIRPVPSSTPGALTCGACGRSWVEDITPAGRCPWEDQHPDPEPSPLVAEIDAVLAEVKASTEADDLEPVLEARDAAADLLARIRTAITEGTTP